MAFVTSARTISDRHVKVPYREDWEPLRDEGFAAYARRVSRPYGEAAASHFDPERRSYTERVLSRIPASPTRRASSSATSSSRASAGSRRRGSAATHTRSRAAARSGSSTPPCGSPRSSGSRSSASRPASSSSSTATPATAPRWPRRSASRTTRCPCRGSSPRRSRSSRSRARASGRRSRPGSRSSAPSSSPTRSAPSATSGLRGAARRPPAAPLQAAEDARAVRAEAHPLRPRGRDPRRGGPCSAPGGAQNGAPPSPQGLARRHPARLVAQPAFRSDDYPSN